MEVLSSEYARAVKIERETKERERRLERRDRRERNKRPENAVLSRYLFSILRLDSNVFNCPGTVPTSLLPYPGLVKTQPRKFVLLLQQTMEVLISDYARAFKIERETKERERRLERRDRQETGKGPENSCTVKVLVFQTSTRLEWFNCPGTVPTSSLPYPGLVKTPPPPPPPPPYEMRALLSRLCSAG